MKEINFEIKVPIFRMPQGWQKKLRITLSAMVVLSSFLAWQNFEFTFVGTLILVYFGISLVWSLSSRFAAIGALFFLVCTPILLILKNDTLAETFSIYAYYFLVITVIEEMIALYREKEISCG